MGVKRNLYLSIQNKEEALQNFRKQCSDIRPQTEVIRTVDSLQRVTAEAVYARYSSPSYNSCAMDGIAVISSHTHGATDTTPVLLRPEVDYLEVDTGDRIQAPYDAVIMAEELIPCEEGYKILAPTHPFAHVRAIGEDIVTREMVLPSFHKIRAIDVSVLLSAGIFELAVVKRPTVAILPTGDEMIAYDEELSDGKIIDTNSYMFENLVREHDGEPHRYPIIKDELALLKETILDAVSTYDIVIVNAGSSAGRDDYTVHAIRELGDVYTHGVAIKPGKPVILGKVQGKPIIGLPGYPVSAYLTFMEFVVPLMKLYTHREEKEDTVQKAILTKTLMSGLKYEEYVRVKLGVVDKKLIATPLERGAGASMSLVKADGFCVIPQNSEGIEAHETVDVRLLKSMDEIAGTLVSIGSHDLILDVIKDMGIPLSSMHVGSMSGLMALRRRVTHIAPTHLLNEADGTYNTGIIKEMFPGKNMVLIKGVRRRQGLIVPKDNPRGIHSVEDLKNDVRYINRQRGAGTRVLFDYELKKAGISTEEINGYTHEATTHMAVAIAVQKGNADAGMGIYSCAKALDLDFIDVAYEEYDFATYEEFLELPMVQAFIGLLKSERFLKKLEELGGYTREQIGEVQYL